jgi:UDP-N-acetyl-D-mannosaminuronic acid dehydrogenase
MNFKKICIFGLGYIGLPTASMFATNGITVLGVDINSSIIATLRAGQLHIHEPGLLEKVRQAIGSGDLTVSTRAEPADAFIISVPTPFFDDKEGDYNGNSYKLADMRAVISAAEAIVPHLRQGNLVVLESTSPPRTTVDLVAPILEKSGLKVGSDFFLVYSPERVLPGQILRELVENARVIGGITPESAEAGRDLYETFVRGEIVLIDATTAEMVKVMENTYRDVNIAIANEFSRLADRFGIDVWESIRIANLHPRVKILNPGPGVGGHCISVDPWFLVEKAPDITSLIYTARSVNDSQPHFVVELVKRALGDDLHGKKIAALGLAYKPEVDDMRESPAVDVVYLLQKEGVAVKAFEPFKQKGDLLNIHVEDDLDAALKEVEAILLLVDHIQFRALTPEIMAQKTTARVLIDTVNGWTEKKWSENGFKLFRIGVGNEKV